MGRPGGEFFDPPPRRAEPERAARPVWAAPPRGVLPAVVRVEAVMACNELVAVYLNSLQAYPAGFEVVVYVVARNGSGLDPFSHRPDREAERDGEIPPGRLRLGFSFADGSKASNTSAFPYGSGKEGEPGAPVMTPRSGHGEEDEWSQTFWVWPLPPPGRLEFVCEWPAAELPLSHTELDSEAINGAARRAQRFFDDAALD